MTFTVGRRKIVFIVHNARIFGVSVPIKRFHCMRICRKRFFVRENFEDKNEVRIKIAEDTKFTQTRKIMSIRSMEQHNNQSGSFLDIIFSFIAFFRVREKFISSSFSRSLSLLMSATQLNFPKINFYFVLFSVCA